MKSLLILLVLCVCAEAKQKLKHKMALTDNLAAYWNFEQNAALDFPIHDQSGNGNHLTATPSGSGAVLVNGKIGNAIEAGGTSRLILASNAGVSHQEGAFTVGFWFKPLILDTSMVILGHPDGQWVVQMELNGGDFYLRIRIAPDDFDATMNVTAVPMVIGEWYWVAFGWYDTNGSFAWASINLSERVRVAVAALPATLTTSPTFWGPHAFDESAIWRRNVPADELYQLYNDGDGLPFEEWDEVKPCEAIECCD